MDERLQQDPGRMTTEEADAVVMRFREQEEAFNREMEARATMPTVKDLAEGLNVPPERVQQILQEIRRSVPEPAQRVVPSEAAKDEVRRQNRSAWTIGAVILAVMFLLGIFAVLLLWVSPAPSIAPPPPVSDTQPVLPDPEGATTVPEPSVETGTAGSR